MSTPASDVTPGNFNGGQVNAVVNGTDAYSIVQGFNFTGGNNGYVTAGLRVTQNTINSGNNFAWAIIGIQNNSSPGGENCGGYMQARRKTSNAGGTWALATEMIDEHANPTKSNIGIEIAHVVKGGTTAKVRRMLDIHAKNFDGVGTAVINDGIRINSVDSGGTTKVENGIVLDGNFDLGIDVSDATFTGQNDALVLSHNQNIHLGDGMRIRYNRSNSRIEFHRQDYGVVGSIDVTVPAGTNQMN